MEKPASCTNTRSEALACFEPDVVHTQTQRRELMKVVYELIDAELDAVCGGIFDFTNLSNNIVAQANTATQVGVAQGGSSVFGAGGAANVAQLLAQSNTSSIG
jgi:hypothetical protein